MGTSCYFQDISVEKVSLYEYNRGSLVSLVKCVKHLMPDTYYNDM